MARVMERGVGVGVVGRRPDGRARSRVRGVERRNVRVGRRRRVDGLVRLELANTFFKKVKVAARRGRL